MLTAPKDPIKNAQFRKAILEQCQGNLEFQQEVWSRCARDIAFYTDVFCLAAGTVVVTDRGPVPIESVTPDDMVWDGDSWVRQGGAVHQGYKSVIFKYGVRLTPEHRVSTVYGWQDASCGYDRKIIRLPDGYRERWSIPQNKVGGVEMSLRMRWGNHNVGEQFAARGSDELWMRKASQETASQARQEQFSHLCNLEFHAGKMQQPETRQLRALWWPGNPGMQSVAQVRQLLRRYGRPAKRENTRKNQQPRSLRAPQCSVGDPQRAGDQYQKCRAEHGSSNVDWSNDCAADRSAARTAHDDHSGTNQKRGDWRSTTFVAEEPSPLPYIAWHAVGAADREDCWRQRRCDLLPHETGHDWRPAAGARKQGQEAVYDLLNCGPKRAFTVIDCYGEPLLVHNCWTFNPKDFPDSPERPFILWPYQEKALLDMSKAIGRHDMLISKSRDMGASWLCLLVLEWRWHFKPHQTFLLVSRNENFVDKKNEPDCLFWKLDFLHSHQPGWILPGIDRQSMAMQNLDNGSSITGASTTSETGRGGRKTAILLDEFAAVKEGDAMNTATQHATNTRLFNSTPKGAVGAYYEIHHKMLDKHPERIVRLHWSVHPLKSPGLYTTETGDEGGALKILDESYRFPENYPFVLDGKLRSPWYDEECDRTPSSQEIAQELDIDFAASGWQFFPQSLIEKWKKEYVRRPLHVGEIAFGHDWSKPEWIEQKGARLQLWFEPTMDGKVPESWNDIVCGCDPATGKGGEMSSNSVASFARRSTGEKLAQFTTNQLFPSDFALYAMSLCTWFNNALLNWENNGGPGGEFGKQVKLSGYTNVYYQPDSETKFAAKRSKEPGWNSGQRKKFILLSDYRKALNEGRFINRCEEALTECSQYVHELGDRVEHARAHTTSDPTASGEAHGDMVIADAVACRAMIDSIQAKEESGPPEPPPNSFAGRRKVWERERKQKRGWGAWRNAG